MQGELHLDELEFYLHCRHLLFKGPQFGIKALSLESMCFLPLREVENVIDTIMEGLP